MTASAAYHRARLRPSRANVDFQLSDQGSQVYYKFAVVAGEAIQVEKDARVTGDVHGNGTVLVKKDALVTGDVSAAGEMTLQGTVTGEVTPGAALLVLPALDLEALRGLADRVFEGDTTFDDHVVIDDVVFVDGTVHFRGSVNGSGTVAATGDVRLDTVGGKMGFVLEETTRLSFVAGGDVRLGKGRPMRGVIRAGHDAQLETATVFEGVIVADHQVLVKKESVVTFVDFDQVAPVITLVSPEDRSVLDASPEEILAEWSDDFSGIDPGSAGIVLDSVDHTGSAMLSGTGLTLPLAEPLSDGEHTLGIVVRDHSANEARETFGFEVAAGPDLLPPDLTVLAPADGARLTASPETIQLAYADAGSGVDVASFRVSLDDLDLTSSCEVGFEVAVCQTFRVPVGAHQVVGEVRDLAGNATTVASEFTVALPEAPPTISVSRPEPGSLTNAEVVTVGGQVFTAGSIVELTVNGLTANLEGDRFQLEVPVEEGPFLVSVRAVDDEGRETVEQAEILVDRTPPVLVVEEPADQQFFNFDKVRIRGTAEDEFGLAEVRVQGSIVEIDTVTFETTVSLAKGGNGITVTALDRAGNKTTLSIGVTFEPTLGITVTEPADQSPAATDSVTVRGTVTGDPVAVTVAGVPADLAGSAFTAEVPLVLGSNPIAIVARDAEGRIGKAVVTVLRDTSPPRIVVTAPLDGEVVFEPTMDVAGLVNDVVGTAVPTGERFTVTVNGQPARVAGGTFLLTGLALQPGVNSLTATVDDESGNRGETSVSVRFEELVAPRLLRISGSGQAATIGTRLPAPLVARAVDEMGQRVAGTPVVFRVTEGDGQFDNGERQVAIFSDADGFASVGVDIGTRAGLGNHVVEAVSVGFAGTARFFLDALPTAPRDLVVDSGDQQTGITGQRLPDPLVAIAVDAAFNPLSEVAVTFRVVQGGGFFENGLDTLEVVTDAQGRASAALILGPQEGPANNAVWAYLGTADEEPPEDAPVAAFAASAMAATSGPTSIWGVVLDNTDQPVPGVTLRIAGTAIEASTNGAGLFVLEDVPAGTIRLEVDGSTTTRPGSWPRLEFVLQAIPGRENELPRPIYLLPLETQGIFVNETEGGVLTLPELPGFELEVAPGSATFPGGSRSGVVSVTMVHSDKVPMIPSLYQQPRLVVTVQPSGTLFEPPARLTLPNLDGREPGEVIDFFSFDHDLARFVSIGPAQVTEDGTAVRSKPGFGIVEGGWHCGNNPSGTGTPHKCPECRKCVNNCCHPEVLCKSCKAGGQGRICDGEGHCVAGVAVIPKICDQIGISMTGPVDVPRNDPLIQSQLGCQPNECYVGVRFTYTGLPQNLWVTNVNLSCGSGAEPSPAPSRSLSGAPPARCVSPSGFAADARR